MSFNRLNYDWNAYQADLRQSVGSGAYALATPAEHEQACFPLDENRKPSQNHPTSTCAEEARIDVSSELLGITRRASRDPDQNYFPGDGSCVGGTRSLRDCPGIHAEDTRLSNPPMTLKGTGWNRWEYLCKDPQQQAFVPFDYNISNRLVAKDNHRPMLQRPIDQSASLPAANASDDVVSYDFKSMKAVEQPSATSWKECGYYTDEYGIAQ